jgi:hypothetical protein
MIVTRKKHRLAAKWDRKARDLVAEVSPRFSDGDMGLLFGVFGPAFLKELKSRGYDLGTLRFRIDKTPEAIQQHEARAGRAAMEGKL